jgi:hypothetical protein
MLISNLEKQVSQLQHQNNQMSESVNTFFHKKIPKKRYLEYIF